MFGRKDDVDEIIEDIDNADDKKSSVDFLMEANDDFEEEALSKEEKKAKKLAEKEARKAEKLAEKEAKKAEKLAVKEAKKAVELETEAETKDAEDAEKSEESEESEKKAEPKKEETKSESEETESYDIIDTWNDDDEDKEKKKKKKSKKKEEKINPEDVNIVRDLLNIIIYIGVVIILCFFILTFVGQRTSVHGDSMNATLEDGDNLWIDKISYRFKDPQRFDVIVFPYQGSETYYIKRIIGLPGETVQIDPNGYIYIDGELLIENYGLEQIRASNIGRACDPILLADDEYFVLGDNRNKSRDSRWSDVGNIKRDIIIGKAAFRITPFNKFGNFDK